MLMTQLRTQMSEVEKDLTNADVIGLFFPEELEAYDTDEGRKVILAKLERALEAEGVRGLDNHWGYSPSRHERLGRLVKVFAQEAKEKEAAAA